MPLKRMGRGGQLLSSSPRSRRFSSPVPPPSPPPPSYTHTVECTCPLSWFSIPFAPSYAQVRLGTWSLLLTVGHDSHSPFKSGVSAPQEGKKVKWNKGETDAGVQKKKKSKLRKLIDEQGQTLHSLWDRNTLVYLSQCPPVLMAWVRNEHEAVRKCMSLVREWVS